MGEDQWRELERREERSARLRDRFGLTDQGSEQQEWLLGPGSVVAALMVVALVVYAVISIVIGIGR